MRQDIEIVVRFCVVVVRTRSHRQQLIALALGKEGLGWDMLLRSPFAGTALIIAGHSRSEEHTSELQSLMRTSYAVFCLKKKTTSSTRYISAILIRQT